MNQPDGERERLTALGGLAALSLDALSSVAYGPEAILVVLVTAGVSALKYSLPITGAIVVLLAALVISYRQVIEAFPNGGGAYAVSKRHLGKVPSLVAAASLIVDYILNAAVGVSAGVEALTAAFPALYGARVWLCLLVLALITASNMWGVVESARIFMVPTLAFIAAMAVVIIGGLVRSQPDVALSHAMPSVTDTVGVLLILKAFASGCSALTGVEAIANSVPQFRKPRAKRAQHTEVSLGVLLGVMLLGLGELIRRWHVVPQSGTTVLAQLTEGAVGHNALYYVIQLITLVLLALAANTSFGGLPVLAGLLARDNFLPHVFGLRADRRVYRYGDRGAGGGRGAAARRLPRRHAGAGAAVRGRGVRRLHAVPGRDGAALAFAAVQWLGLPRLDQRRRGGADLRCHRDRAGQQVPRRGVAGRDRHPAARAAVPRGGPGVRADRRAARDRPGAAAAREAARRSWSCRSWACPG